YDFDYLIFIGRFQPFHHGHEFIVREALVRAKQVILLIGSANSPRTIKNPFTFAERKAMILQSFDTATAKRLICLPIDDTLYNDHKWLHNIRSTVNIATKSSPKHKIGVIGHTKDDSSYYLSLFPDWAYLELPNFQNLSATPLRQAYFGQADSELYQKMPAASAEFLQQFRHSHDFVRLQNEFHHINDYRQSFHHLPYPPIFVTTDALVVQSGHILLIERGGEYGNGLWALPGGFLDENETLLQGVLRELKEETSLSLSQHDLKSTHTFDAPERSLRARTLTTVFHFVPPHRTLPTVQGNDDAKQAFWLPLDELDGERMFEDHYSIITKILGL
ncbi:MAG: bifunctional nicotinamide-nucleotide adenylyltransferase/Nudix hydroxylase, partial [Moraxella sp.]|nr:bifunctional nicotinamide-nucleotide adenylyltransferase/Nudix hydroxylase [Moraxella sp.]